MRAEDFLLSLEYLHDEYLALADDIVKEENMNIKKSTKKIRRTLLIAAIIATLFCSAAVAAGAYITSPAKAWQVARDEIERMKDLGILAHSVELPESQERAEIFEVGGQTGSKYWFGRIWNPEYSVSCSTEDYHFSLDVDTITGKITRLSMEAFADENDIPTGKTIEIGDKTYNYYNNYYDIFPEDVTIDRFCSALSEYWGFSGYTLAGTEDSFYGYDTEAPSGEMKLIDFPENNYITVFFEGDQPGVPMYIQKEPFPGRVYFTLGTNHLVG